MKRIIAFILALMLCISLVACGDEGKKKSNRENTSTSMPRAIEIKENETISIHNTCEFYIESISILDKITPASPDKWYNYHEADEGKTYVDICFHYKNTDTESKHLEDDIESSLFYGENYVYNGFVEIEEYDRSDFKYDDEVIPLANEYVHILYEIPDGVATGDGALVAILKVHNENYSIKVRSGSNKFIEPKSSNSSEKSGGKLTVGEIVYQPENCEFFIEYYDITKKVVPKDHDSVYSYYEAEGGKVYVDFCISYKSLAFEEVDLDSIITANLRYDKSYTYSANVILEIVGSGSFTKWGDIMPLSTEYIHCLFEVPEELKDSEKSIVIDFKIGSKSYSLNVR